mgnify:FL=1
MWKFKAGKEAEMMRFLSALESLRGQIDVIRSMKQVLILSEKATATPY